MKILNYNKPNFITYIMLKNKNEDIRFKVTASYIFAIPNNTNEIWH